MAWPAQRKSETRQRILQSAAELFNRHGFDQVSIGDVMENAQLTHGGFYAHFDSKHALYAEAIKVAGKTSLLSRIPSEAISDTELLSYLVNAYLSKEHLEPNQPSCPLAFLATDIAHQKSEVQESYTKLYKGLVNYMNRLMSEPVNSDKSLAISALMIGGVALARVLQDEDLVDRLLSACQTASDDIIRS